MTKQTTVLETEASEVSHLKQQKSERPVIVNATQSVGVRSEDIFAKNLPFQASDLMHEYLKNFC